jgi:hypothetical protein
VALYLFHIENKTFSMKKIIMFVCLFCMAVSSVSAQMGPLNDLTIFAEQGEAFYLVINGQRQNNVPQTNVKVKGLNLPNYKLKIIFADSDLGELDKTILMPAEPAEVVYNLRKGKDGAYVLRFNSAAPLAVAPPPPPAPVSPPPAAPTTVVVETPAPAATTITQTTVTQSQGSNASVGMSVGGMNVGMNININDPFLDGTTTTTTTTRSTTVSRGGNVQVVSAQPVTPPPPPPSPVPGYNGRIGCNGFPMDAGSFSSALAAIQDADFEDTKKSTAKSIINGQCLTTDQVVSICRQFDFEATKLDFAKFAYTNTIDIGNYFKVNQVFDFDASKSDLNRFVSGR